MKKTIKNILITCVFCLTLLDVNAKVYNVKLYGAKGDGKTDNYLVLLKIADAINKNKGGEIYFPPGDYYIAQYHTNKSPKKNITFKNVNGLTIKGKNARISVNGSFHRGIDRKHSRFSYSNTMALTPIQIENSENIEIEGLDLNGNVDKMTREASVAESGGHLMIIKSSKNVYLKNMNIKFAQTDGIYITGNSSYVKAENLVCSNNARQGMSIIGLKNGSFTNCSFINTGITGKYGGHAPKAGVDLEPHGKKNSVKNIVFTNCLFENNLGSEFVVSHVNTTSDVHLKNCTFNSLNNYPYSIIANAVNVIFTGCEFNLMGRGSIYPIWHKDGASSSYINCVIKTEYRGIVATGSFPNQNVVVSGCTFEYTGNKPMNSYMPYLQMKNMEFVNNKIIIPKRYYKKSGVNSLIQQSKKVQENKFYSDGELLQNPKVSYAKSNVLD